MPRCVADLHIHSKYSRATSPNMELEGLSEWGKIKGIDVIGTGDFTHPKWIKELKEKAIEEDSGLLLFNGQHFMLTVELSSIYTDKGRGRRIHQVVLAPSLEIAEQINERLKKKGANLASDGRPIMGLSAPDIVETIMEISPKCMVIPAHAWTPWFSVFGSKSGFDSVKECYGDMEKHIYALETGLSSDPAMNWRVSALDKYALVSNSDSHSPQKIGREANVFELNRLTYDEIVDAIKDRSSGRFKLTYEFYPEEGKYHLDGHRDCGVRLTPAQTKKLKGLCPKCGKAVVIGVQYRVEELADREEGFVPKGAVPFEKLVPLAEIIAKVLGGTEASKKVLEMYAVLVKAFGNEIKVLHAPYEQLKLASDERIAKAICDVREGNITFLAGYDGTYGEMHFGKRKIEQEDYTSRQKSITDF
ncbi:Uncharacterised protein [Candidatus Anstonella stagnisolia]|nr:Uncharacterised protein [Candidatus Anstonella stagnisolia]